MKYVLRFTGLRVAPEPGQNVELIIKFFFDQPFTMLARNDSMIGWHIFPQGVNRGRVYLPEL
jgi:hypothetical protein